MPHPRRDGAARDDEAAIDDEHEQRKARNGVGDRWRVEEGADEAEDLRDRQRGRRKNQREGKEVARAICRTGARSATCSFRDLGFDVVVGPGGVTSPAGLEGARRGLISPVWPR